MERKRKLFRRAALLLVIAALALPLLVMSCGSEYETPSTTQTPTALISADTLKAWMDAGKVNGTGYDRVLVLDVNAQATYDAGHIPGALWINNALISETRNEGVADTGNMVLRGSSMDALIQGLGIDGSTTIVFTGSSLPTTAYTYWVFRYWGFPKNRLKLLDGMNSAANLTILGTATGAQPTIARSTYSVINNRHLRKELRASLAEMIAVAEGDEPDARVVDARHDAVYPPAPSGSLAFGGIVRGSQRLAFNDATIQTGNVFASTSSLVAAFAGVGIDSAKTAYSYCLTGYRGAVLFFALDGILGWPVVLYDGSWNQWGTLAAENPTPANNNLSVDSPWRTDILSVRSESMTYNSGAFTPLAGPNSYAPSANLIEEEDFIYMRSGSGSSGSGGGGGGIPSGC